MTTKRERAFAFGLHYAVMNLGGAAGETLIDIIRTHTWMMPWGQEYSGLRFCLLLTWFAAVYAWLFAMKMQEPSSELPSCVEHNGCEPLAPSEIVLVMEDDHQNLPRAVFLTAAVTFVSLQWKCMDTLLPKFADRMFGASCLWGTICSINRWICVVCPPIISAVDHGKQIDDFWLILLGLWIMALSPLTIWASVSKSTTVMWVTLVSGGEMLWLPRFRKLIASLAPDGKETAFLAVAGIPNVVSQYPAGVISGWLQNTYCP